MNALESYRAAVALRRSAVMVVNAANETLLGATLHADEQRYLATVALACPSTGCGAAVDEPCNWGPHDKHRYVTHGLRQDASGVNERTP